MPKPGLRPDPRPFRPAAFSDSRSLSAVKPPHRGSGHEAPHEGREGQAVPGSPAHIHHYRRPGKLRPVAACHHALCPQRSPRPTTSHLPVHSVSHKQASTSMPWIPQSLLACKAVVESPSSPLRTLTVYNELQASGPVLHSGAVNVLLESHDPAFTGSLHLSLIHPISHTKYITKNINLEKPLH